MLKILRILWAFQLLAICLTEAETEGKTESEESKIFSSENEKFRDDKAPHHSHTSDDKAHQHSHTSDDKAHHSETSDNNAKHHSHTSDVEAHHHSQTSDNNVHHYSHTSDENADEHPHTAHTSDRNKHQVKEGHAHGSDNAHHDKEAHTFKKDTHHKAETQSSEEAEHRKNTLSSDEESQHAKNKDKSKSDTRTKNVDSKTKTKIIDAGKGSKSKYDIIRKPKGSPETETKNELAKMKKLINSINRKLNSKLEDFPTKHRHYAYSPLLENDANLQSAEFIPEPLDPFSYSGLKAPRKIIDTDKDGKDGGGGCCKKEGDTNIISRRFRGVQPVDPEDEPDLNRHHSLSSNLKKQNYHISKEKYNLLNQIRYYLDHQRPFRKNNHKRYKKLKNSQRSWVRYG